MGVYPLDKIVREWGKGNLTSEQVIGQILQLIQQLQEQISELQSRVYHCEQARKP